MSMNRIKLETGAVRVPFTTGMTGEEADGRAVKKASDRIRRITGAVPENLRVARKSIDARRGEISFVYTVYGEIEADGKRVSKILRSAEESGEIRIHSDPVLEPKRGDRPLNFRPVIVGFGPAGMFAGLLLASEGYSPLILERGGSVEERTAAVERFIRDGILDPECNVQFGAGGAGTFSDGKLTTRISDPLTAWVMQTLRTLGAPDDILYKSKPHIGTDVLRQVVKNADAKIRSMGGEIRYHAAARGIGNGRLTACGEQIPYDALILAVGHSARDTVGELIASGFAVEAKPFSVGVRAEHLQKDIDEALFHEHAGDPSLGRGEYQLSYRRGDRGCYTFCMCPGGVVVPSASEEGGVVTNGMSERARDGVNANAAVCVSVHPSDFGGSPLEAIAFQRELERRAFEAGGRTYAAPFQTVGDLMEGKSGSDWGRIVPTYRNGAVVPADFGTLLPPFAVEMLREGLADFGRKLKGYDRADVPLTGIETRTSSPVRILRGEDGRAVGRAAEGIYPCGEGAGYAGGIVSAAVDGVRTALKLMEAYRPAEQV
jgi:hypothetical protein